VAALGQDQGLALDLDGDYLEDRGSPPPERSASLQLDAARPRHAAGRSSKRPALDNVKLGLYRTAAAIVEPLRGSETMRRVIRRIALGKNANYHLKKA
jgi:hypothetical protein